MAGTAADGGLFVPERVPPADLDNIPVDAPINEVARRVIEPFFAGSGIAAQLGTICDQAFNFPAPLRTISTGDQPLSVLELFHGPTAAFKDFGARFLAESLERLLAAGMDCVVAKPLTPSVLAKALRGGSGPREQHTS